MERVRTACRVAFPWQAFSDRARHAVAWASMIATRRGARAITRRHLRLASRIGRRGGGLPAGRWSRIRFDPTTRRALLLIAAWHAHGRCPIIRTADLLRACRRGR